MKRSGNTLDFARQQKKIIAKRLTDPAVYLPEEQPVSIFMAGSPGAGKTEASLELINEVGGALLRVDPDELRCEFDGYDGSNSWLFQPAVSVLVERILDTALKQRQSYLLDGTLTNFDKAKENIQRALKRDRAVQVLYVYQEPRQAWSFVQAREATEGRRIEPDTFVRQYFEARRVVNRLKAGFGSAIDVDLLLKNNDGTHRAYQANIDQIDNHVPEKYDPLTLQQLLDRP
jgi:UDP-N-acetylglucosamine kinase